MTGEYTTRLLCLSLASFFAVQLAAGVALRLAAPWIARAAARLAPRTAARLMLGLRWAPGAAGCFVVGALCIPSYLWLEPGETGEELGLLCLAGTALAAAVWIAALCRGARLVLRSRRRVRNFAIASPPVLAIAGFLRPRLLISPAVREALSPEQLEIALRHERAHGQAHDNLKRLLLAFTPDLLPGVRAFAGVERQWARYAEWAADDDAVAGDPERALALAAALVRVARLGAVAVPLASSMLEGGDLAARIGRLLAPAPPRRAPHGALAAASAAAVATALVALALRPASLESAHRLLEGLVK